MSVLRHSLSIAAFALLAAPAIAADLSTTPEQVLVSAVEARVVQPVFAKHGKRYEALGGPGPYYPERAARQAVSGSVVLQCGLRASGLLEACKVVSETPKDYAFGDASLRMAERRAMGAEPRMVDGKPVDGEIVRLVIPFNAPGRR